MAMDCTDNNYDIAYFFETIQAPCPSVRSRGGILCIFHNQHPLLTVVQSAAPAAQRLASITVVKKCGRKYLHVSCLRSALMCMQVSVCLLNINRKRDNLLGRRRQPAQSAGMPEVKPQTARSRSASPQRDVERTLLIEFRGESDEDYQTFALKPGTYSKAELALLSDWSTSPNIFETHMFVPEVELPEPRRTVSCKLEPTTREEAMENLLLAARFNLIWDKKILTRVVEPAELVKNSYESEGPIKLFMISTFC